jgi:hypothetical protein
MQYFDKNFPEYFAISNKILTFAPVNKKIGY